MEFDDFDDIPDLDEEDPYLSPVDDGMTTCKITLVKYDKSIASPSTTYWALPKLYSVDANNNIRVWEIMFDGQFLTILHGRLDGKLITDTERVVPKSKRTLNEQAWLRATKRYNDKLVGDGYRESIEELSSTNEIAYWNQNPNVMRAQKYTPGTTKLEFPVEVSIKYDGERVVAYVGPDGDIVLRSRKGRVFSHLTHIKSELSYIFDDYPHLVLDGELYIHGAPLQEIRGIISTTTHVHARSKEVDMQIFDIIVGSGEIPDDAPYSDRYKFMKSLGEKHNSLVSIKVAPSYSCADHWQITTLHDGFVSQGYEGAMIRVPTAPYSRTRSRNLLKYKQFDDEEGTIIDVLDCRILDGREQGLAIFKILRDNGVEFNCRPSGNFELRRLWLQHKHVILYSENGIPLNRRYTFKYFGNNKDGTPNIATGVAFRDERDLPSIEYKDLLAIGKNERKTIVHDW